MNANGSDSEYHKRVIIFNQNKLICKLYIFDSYILLVLQIFVELGMIVIYKIMDLENSDCVKTVASNLDFLSNVSDKIMKNVKISDKE